MKEGREEEDEKKLKKSQEKSFYILSYMWKFGNETKISIWIDMHPRESSLLSSCIDHDVACFSIMKRAELVSYNGCR